MASNEMSRGLLFTADPYSKIVDNDNKNTTLLFGDGATVTYLSDSPAFLRLSIRRPLTGRLNRAIESRWGDDAYLQWKTLRTDSHVETRRTSGLTEPTDDIEVGAYALIGEGVEQTAQGRRGASRPAASRVRGQEPRAGGARAIQGRGRLHDRPRPQESTLGRGRTARSVRSGPRRCVRPSG